MTLVLMVPCNQGLVIAADSRRGILNHHCDIAFKIVELDEEPPSAITVTGNGTFIAAPPPDVVDLCEYLKATLPTLNIAVIAKSFVEASGVDVEIAEVAARCLTELSEYRAQRPEALAPFAGRELCAVILATYCHDQGETCVRRFVIRLSPTLEPEADDISTTKFTADDQREYLAFGETGYLNQHVFGGVGREFLSDHVINFLRNQKIIREIDLNEAVDVATDLIQATSLTTAHVQAPTGIGGPIDVLLLGGEPKPTRLSWKPA